MIEATSKRHNKSHLLTHAKAYVAAMVDHLIARKRLLQIQAKQAAAHHAWTGAYGAILAFIGVIGYILLVFAAVFALALLWKGDARFLWATLIVAGFHFAAAAGVFLLLKKNIEEPAIPPVQEPHSEGGAVTAALQESKNRWKREGAVLAEKANVGRQFVQSVRRRPGPWLAGLAFMAGLLWARRRGRSHTAPRHEANAAPRRGAVLSGLVLAAIKMGFNAYRPAIMEWVRSRAMEAAENFQRRGKY